MSVEFNPNAKSVNGPAAYQDESGPSLDYQKAAMNYSILGTAIATMGDVMILFQELSNAKFAQMKKSTEVSRDAQEMANKVEAILAGLNQNKDTRVVTQLPEDVIRYLRENGVDISYIDPDIGLEGWLDVGDLTGIRGALESFSGRASDFVQQSQLKLQQLLQNFNTAVTMANSVQSMNAESTKSIAQSIR